MEEQHLTKYNAALILMNEKEGYKHTKLKTRIKRWCDMVCCLKNNYGEGMLCEEERDEFKKMVFRLMINPNYLCEVLKAMFVRNVLAIKYKGIYLHKMFMDYTPNLFWYLFDDTKLLYFVRRFCNGFHPTIHFPLRQKNTFKRMVEDCSPYFYQTAPDTENADFFKRSNHFIKRYKNNEVIGCIHDDYGNMSNRFNINFGVKHLTPRIVENRIKKNLHYEMEFFYENWYNVRVNNNAGTHFTYNFDLKKNVLLWDASKEQHRHQRIVNLFRRIRTRMKNHIPENKHLLFFQKLYTKQDPKDLEQPLKANRKLWVLYGHNKPKGI